MTPLDTPPRSSPESAGRHFRVFVCSTFRDMVAERDHLVKVVFPQLRRVCESRGVTWGEVDLRWGITSEEVAEGRVLPLCLEQIQRCRPYFIGLLGERYGWVPKSIDPEFVRREPWLREHAEASVTEIEIVHGVLSDQAPGIRGCFYFRAPAGAATPDEPVAARDRLERLKARIRAASRAGICLLHEGYRDVGEMGRQVLADLQGMIDRQFPEGSKEDPLAIEHGDQLEFGRRRARLHVGREDVFDRIDRHVAGDRQPLIVLGEAGLGKTALLASWCLRHARRHPEDLQCVHFIGGTPDSTRAARIVRHLMWTLRSRNSEAFPDLHQLNERELPRALASWIETAARLERRVVLVLDGLDQVEDRDGEAELRWLPDDFPTNCRVIASSRRGADPGALLRRGWAELTLEPLSPDARGELIRGFLAQFGKRLPPAELASISSSGLAGNPQLLLAMLDELRQFGHFEQLAERTQHYLAARDGEDLYSRILDRWESDFGRELVWSALALLWAARRGLSESELLDMLGDGLDPFPQARWSPFALAIEASLVSRSGLLAFSHDLVRLAVVRRILPKDEDQRRAHQCLADYFAKRWDLTDRKLDELPWQWVQAREWEQLEQFLAKPPVLERLHGDVWRKWELQSWWQALPDGVAVAACRDGLAEWERTPRRPLTLIHYLVELANFHFERQELAAAEVLLRRALVVSEAELRPNHPRTGCVLNNLALVLDEMGRPAEAEPMLRHAITILERRGSETAVLSRSRGNLAQVLQRLGQFAEAEAQLRHAQDDAIRALSPDDEDVGLASHNLASFLRESGRLAEAEPLQARALAIYEKRFGEMHPRVVEALGGQGDLWLALGRLREAELVLRRALSIARATYGPEHPTTLGRLLGVEAALRAQGRAAEAEALFREAAGGTGRA